MIPSSPSRSIDPYSRKLFDSLPGVVKRGRQLAVIRGSVPSLARRFEGCRFAERCDYAWEACHTTVPGWTRVVAGHRVRCHLADPRFAGTVPGEARKAAPPPVKETEPRDGTILEVEDLKVHFPIHKGVLKRVVGYVHAVDGVSMRIRAGQTLALVGESGCGKTTVGKGLLQLIRPTAGSVRFDDVELTRLRGEALRRRRADLQIIFQDPYSSMNPRMMVGDIIEEGMITQKIDRSASERRRRVEELLAQVGLSADHRHRYPHEFSGGQRQRICVARALAVNPKLMICDEPTSALDVSVQAQILNLLSSLQFELGLSYLFITHNLAVVEYLAHEVAVMYLGRVVECGTTKEVLKDPKHPYTQALLSAVPVIEPGGRREVIRLKGELPSPVNPPAGCHFHPRCPHAMPVCRERYPGATQMTDSHVARCYLYSPQAEPAGRSRQGR